MKTLLIVFILSLFVAFNFAQELNGNWKGVVETPNGAMELLFDFNVVEDTLNGTVTSEMGSLPLENGKASGNEFSYEININGNVFSSNGIVEGDTVKISGPMMETPMILTRVADKSKIDGRWVGTASSPQGDFELTFTLKVDGNTLTGKNSSAMGETDLTNGKVNGNEFSFDVDMNGMVISHKCKYLPNDTIEVKVLMMDQEMSMNLSRAD